MQRRQPPAGAANPIAQRGTIQCDALAGEDLRLTIQRQMVAVLADEHMRQQRLGRHATVNGTLRRRRLYHAVRRLGNRSEAGRSPGRENAPARSPASRSGLHRCGVANRGSRTIPLRMSYQLAMTPTLRKASKALIIHDFGTGRRVGVKTGWYQCSRMPTRHARPMAEQSSAQCRQHTAQGTRIDPGVDANRRAVGQGISIRPGGRAGISGAPPAEAPLQRGQSVQTPHQVAPPSGRAAKYRVDPC